ncbi:MAG: MFS transporter [Desulfobacteraceae bacterium]|jgi:MFS family permease|nr:MFS transporter [Desulfobacteraceae bacterium]
MDRDRAAQALILAAFCMMVGVGAIVSILPGRILALSGAKASLGLLSTSFALAYVAAQLPVGYLADRFGVRAFLVSGYLVCTVAGLIFFIAPQPGLIFLGRFIQGLGEAPVWALGPALLSVQFAERRGSAMGRYNAAIHIGLTAGPLIGYLARGNAAFGIYSLLCLIGAAILHFGLAGADRTPRVPGQRVRPKDVGRLLAAPGVGLDLWGILLWGGAYGMFLTVIPGFLIVRHGAPAGLNALFFVLFYAMISLSQLVVGPVIDRMGRRRFMRAGLAAGALGMGLFPFAGLWWALGLLTLAAFGLGTFYLASMARLNDAAPAELKGSISGAYYLAWGVGMSVAAVAVEALSARWHPGAGFVVFAGLLALQACLARRRPQPNASAL